MVFLAASAKWACRGGTCALWKRRWRALGARQRLSSGCGATAYRNSFLACFGCFSKTSPIRVAGRFWVRSWVLAAKGALGPAWIGVTPLGSVVLALATLATGLATLAGALGAT